MEAGRERENAGFGCSAERRNVNPSGVWLWFVRVRRRYWMERYWKRERERERERKRERVIPIEWTKFNFGLEFFLWNCFPLLSFSSPGRCVRFGGLCLTRIAFLISFWIVNYVLIVRFRMNSGARTFFDWCILSVVKQILNKIIFHQGSIFLYS